MISDLFDPPSTIHHPPSTPQAFSFREFQVEDFSRAAMHSGAIVALDPGGGKTLGSYTIPFMRHSRRTLIVAPPSLIEQIQTEGETFFGIRPTIIRNQAEAYALMRSGHLPFCHQDETSTPSPLTGTDHSLADPRFFITAYTWLGYNGADEVAPPETDEDEDSSTPRSALHTPRYLIPDPWRLGIGETRDYDGWEIKCVGTPSLSTLIAYAFDTVCCDEAVRIKSGADAHIARGVLQLRAANRYAFTGTPIKNKLADVFFLAAWVCGYNPDPTARWPFGNTKADQHDFCRNHLIMEENDSAYQRTGRRLVKYTNRVCNVHRLWKLFGPVIIRRRKDDMGDLPPKIFKPLHFAPGKDQFQAYSWHAANRPKRKTPLASMGAQLGNLRLAALAPWSTKLGNARSGNSMTPKIAGILQLTADLMAQDEQLVVFSPFQEFATTLAGYFTRAGIPHAVLDGRMSPMKRGIEALRFKSRELPVIICGIESMGEGHSFHMASNLVLPSLTWAWDKNAQAIDRVHRLISRKAVNIWIMATKGTIDERLLSMFHEKGDSNDLALDGRLFQNEREDVDLADLLRETLENFDPTTKTIDEDEILRNYKAVLLPRLTQLAHQWQQEHVAAPARGRPSKKRPASSPAPRRPSRKRTTSPASSPQASRPAPARVKQLAPALAADTMTPATSSTPHSALPAPRSRAISKDALRNLLLSAMS